MWPMLSHIVAFWKDIQLRAKDYCSSIAHHRVTLGNSLNLSELCSLIYKTLPQGLGHTRHPKTKPSFLASFVWVAQCFKAVE